MPKFAKDLPTPIQMLYLCRRLQDIQGGNDLRLRSDNNYTKVSATFSCFGSVYLYGLSELTFALG